MGKIFMPAAENVIEGDILPICPGGNPEVWDGLMYVTGMSWGLQGILIKGHNMMTGEYGDMLFHPSHHVIAFERI
jgi:hypothetical protein